MYTFNIKSSLESTGFECKITKANAARQKKSLTEVFEGICKNIAFSMKSDRFIWDVLLFLCFNFYFCTK